MLPLLNTFSNAFLNTLTNYLADLESFLLRTVSACSVVHFPTESLHRKFLSDDLQPGQRLGELRFALKKLLI